MNFLKKYRNVIFTIIASFILGLLILFLSPDEKNAPAAENLSVTQKKEWVNIIAEDAAFTIDMPSNPRHIFLPKKENIPARGTFISDGENGTQYIVVIASYPDSTIEEKQGTFFRAELDEFIASNPKNQLLSFDETASIFIIQNIEDGSTFQGKIIQQENTLYTFVVFHPYEQFPQKDYERFMNSFSFL